MAERLAGGIRVAAFQIAGRVREVGKVKETVVPWFSTLSIQMRPPRR